MAFCTDDIRGVGYAWVQYVVGPERYARFGLRAAMATMVGCITSLLTMMSIYAAGLAVLTCTRSGRNGVRASNKPPTRIEDLLNIGTDYCVGVCYESEFYFSVMPFLASNAAAHFLSSRESDSSASFR